MRTIGQLIAKSEEHHNEQRWLDDHGKEYGEFTRNFVAPRQTVWHLNGGVRGSEQFGQHVAETEEGGIKKPEDANP